MGCFGREFTSRKVVGEREEMDRHLLVGRLSVQFDWEMLTVFAALGRAFHTHVRRRERFSAEAPGAHSY